MTTREWVEMAACRGVDTNVFFPGDDRSEGGKEYDMARTICASCPVAQDCLRYAIELDIPGGMWGGMSRRQRRIEYKTNRSKYQRVYIQMEHGTQAMYRRELEIARQGGAEPCDECRAYNRRNKHRTV